MWKEVQAPYETLDGFVQKCYNKIYENKQRNFFVHISARRE